MSLRCGIVLIAASLVASTAGADVLCRARSGRVFLRTGCKKHEVVVDLPKGPTGDQGAASGIPVRLVDSVGHPVGLFAEPGHEDDVAGVVFEVGSRLVTFLANRAGFNAGGELQHLVAHCADAPLVSTPSAPLLRYGIVIGSTAYYAEDPIETKSPVSREYFPNPDCGFDETLPNGHCCTPTSAALLVGPATLAFDLPSLGLTPPFRLEP